MRTASGAGKGELERPATPAVRVALEAVRQAIGHCAQRIAEAEAAGESASDEIAMLRAEQAAWAARAQALDPLDTGAVKQLRTDADDLLSEDEDGAGE